MFVARIQLNLHECRRRFIVQQLKKLRDTSPEFELMAQAFLRAVRPAARPRTANMRVQTIGFQVRFSCGFEYCKASLMTSRASSNDSLSMRPSDA